MESAVRGARTQSGIAAATQKSRLVSPSGQFTSAVPSTPRSNPVAATGDLAKAGAYNSLAQKRITAIAAVRNSAAHGKSNEFTRVDVLAMTRDVEPFVATKVV